MLQLLYKKTFPDEPAKPPAPRPASAAVPKSSLRDSFMAAPPKARAQSGRGAPRDKRAPVNTHVCKRIVRTLVRE